MERPTNKKQVKRKTLLFAFVFLFPSFFVFGQSENLNLLIKTIDQSRGGNIRVGLFNTPESFKNKENPVYQSVNLADDSVIYFSFSIPKGTYAIAVFHDENEDEKLNTKTFGIPLEGVGFSGKLKSKIKPPDFDQASFKLESDTTIVFGLRYSKSDN